MGSSQHTNFMQRLSFSRPRLHSLTLKLTLAFLVVGLLGALPVAFIVGLRTQNDFNNLITATVLNPLSTILEQDYATTGSWAGAADVIARYRANQEAVDRRPLPPPVLLDAQGRVVVGNERYRVGTLVGGSALPPSSKSLTVGGARVGTLVVDIRGRGQDPEEARFIASVQRTIIYSALGAIGTALLLGVVLARTLTHPIRELTEATQAVAKGALGRQVAVRSRDELGTLATAFNHMSADLAHATNLRRQMTADIAHDLRTPLSVILGYTEALRDGMLPPDQETFDTMHIEAQHLQHLIDDLRTLSLADAGELRLVRQSIAPQALVERAAAAHRAQAQERGIMLVMNSAPDLPPVDVDTERMAQVLGNLISNALRYTPAGGTITLAAEQCGDDVCLRVQDTGSGIAPEDLPHIFDRFYRGDAAREQTGASGLGLAIAKGIVEAHGGQIMADSRLGQGTTFTILVPAAACTPHAHELISA